MSSGSTPFSSRRNQCRICKRPETPVIKPIVRCNNCHGGYHTYCHNPKIDFKQINAAWICYKCTKKLKRGPRRSDILKEAQVEISSNENNGSSIQRNANKSTAFVGNNTLMNCETLSSSGLATRAINFEVVIETRRSTPGASDPECSQQPQNLPMPTTVKDYQDTIIGPHSSIDTYMPISALCDDNQGVAISGFSEGALQGSIKPVQSILPSEVRNSQEEVEHSLSEAPMSIDSSSPTSPRMTEHHDAQPNHYSKDNFLNNRSKSSSPYSPPPAESTGNEDVWKSSRMSRSNCRICGVPGQDASASMICINCQSRELNPEEIQSSHIGQNGSKNARRDSKESCIRSYDHQKMKISTENLAVPKTEPSSQSLQRVRTSKEIVAERYNMKHIPFDPHAHMRQLAASSGTMAARKNAPRVPQPSVRRSHKYEPGRGSITPIAADNSSGINKQTRSSSTPSTAKKNSRKRGPALKNAGKLTRRRSVSTSSDLDIEDDEFAQRIKDQKGYTKKQMERGAQLERELREERRELREERRRADRAIRGKTIAEKQLYQVIKEKAALEKSINESRQNGRGREGEDLNVEHLMDVDDPPQNAPKGISMREVYKDHVFNNISPWGDRARTPSPKGKKPIQRPEKSDYVPWDRSKLMNIHIHRQTDRQRKPCIGIVPQVEVAASGDDEECSPYIMHSQRISFDEFMGIPQNMVPAVKDGKLSFRAGAINPRYRTLDRNVPFYKLRFLGDLY
ncbi:hypothetical protein EDC01DRAFT_368658 [Geopyxis carbonaria]|nr:hypothetical protein EDC01DRAFT_368658 [Geopyxis carbonaria]